MWKVRCVDKGSLELTAYYKMGKDIPGKSMSGEEEDVFKRWQVIWCV